MPLAAPLGSPVSHTLSPAVTALAASQMGGSAAAMGALMSGLPMTAVPGLSLGGGDGIVAQGSPDVLVNDLPAGRVTDKVTCHPGAAVLLGSLTVYINDLPAARVGDPTTDGAVIIDGSPNVIIGGGSTAAPSHPPPCLRAGIASGVPFLSGF